MRTPPDKMKTPVDFMSVQFHSRSNGCEMCTMKIINLASHSVLQLNAGVKCQCHKLQLSVLLQVQLILT